VKKISPNIMSSLINWLKRPYYFNIPPTIKLLISFCVGGFIWFFLFFFRPFNLINYHPNIFYYTLGFGLIALFVNLFVFFALPYFLKNTFKDDEWSVGKGLLFHLGMILTITVLNWYYNSKVQSVNNYELISFSTFISYTFSVGFIPLVILVFVEELFTRKKNEKNASELNSLFEKKPSLIEGNTAKEIIITTMNSNESLRISITNLIYVNSQGNYSCFFVLIGSKIEEKVLRTPLQNVTNQLKEYPNFVRCHKSYIVNSKHIDKISGNARGYILHSNKTSISIPVSRKFQKKELHNLFLSSTL